MKYFYWNTEFKQWVAWIEYDEMFYSNKRKCMVNRYKNILTSHPGWEEYQPGYRNNKKEFKSLKQLTKFVWLMHPEKFT